jgi:hypothetical protein
LHLLVNNVLPVKTKLTISVLICMLTLSCEKTPPEATTEELMDGSWVTYSPYKWPHDANPVEGIYCIVYSDGASQDLRQKVAGFVDNKWEYVLELFDFENTSDFLYPPGYDRIDVYISRYNEPRIAAAYWGSVLITILSDNVNIENYDYLFKHELTHVFEFLIEGTVNLEPDHWFVEGVAIYCGGGFEYLTTVEDLDYWISINSSFPGTGNPIAIHRWDDYPEGSDKTGYYCYVYDVTMKYILDPAGLGRSLQDIVNLFYDIRNGSNFPDAFQSNFGIDLVEFEENYFETIRSYLNDKNH